MKKGDSQTFEFIFNLKSILCVLISLLFSLSNDTVIAQVNDSAIKKIIPLAVRKLVKLPNADAKNAIEIEDSIA